MKKVSEKRLHLRVLYARETDKILIDNIGAYADWLETKLAEIGFKICPQTGCMCMNKCKKYCCDTL